MGVLSILASAFLALPAKCAQSDSFWYRDGALAQDFITRFEKTVIVVDNMSSRGRGTGVLVLNPEGRAFIVTVAHIVKAADSRVSVYLTADDGQQVPFTTVISSINVSSDLAALELEWNEKELSQLQRAGFLPIGTRARKNAALFFEHFASTEQVHRGYEVMFLGFPLNAGTKDDYVSVTGKDPEGKEIPLARVAKLARKSPIARFGRVASEIDDDSGDFLIDAMVSHGNSGAPVFVRTGDEQASSFLFAGIIGTFKSDDIAFRSDDGQEINIPHNSGLGSVISAAVIKSFLENIARTDAAGGRAPKKSPGPGQIGFAPKR
jgi:S1-C subfamily serine protease